MVIDIIDKIDFDDEIELKKEDLFTKDITYDIKKDSMHDFASWSVKYLGKDNIDKNTTKVDRPKKIDEWMKKIIGTQYRVLIPYKQQGIKHDFIGYNYQRNAFYMGGYIMDGNKYLKSIKENHHNVEMRIQKLSGMPTIKKTRIPISLIISCFRDNISFKDIEKEYHITDEQIKDALDYVIDVLDRPFMGEEEDDMY